MIKKPAFYFILGIFLLSGGWLLQNLKGDYYTSQQYFINVVEENIADELMQMEFEMTSVLDSISTAEILRFGDANLHNSYPYFVFRNQELKIWTDYSFVPTYDQIVGDYSIKLLSDQGNVFIQRKWFVNTKAGQLEVVSILPISKTYSVQNKYLTDNIDNTIFQNQEVNVFDAPGEGTVAIELRERPIFWISLRDNFTFENALFNIFLLVVYTISILLLLTAWFIWSLKFATGTRKWLLIVALIMAWGTLKVGMNLFEFPGSLLPIELFNSRFFAVSWFEKSFGDMLINTVMIFAISIVVFRFYRIVNPSNTFGYLLRLLFAIGYVFLLNLIINYQYLQLRTIYFNSQISIDITRSLEFDSFRILTALVFVLISVSTVLLFHVIIKRFDQYIISNKERIAGILLGSILFWGFTNIVNLPVANLVFVTILIMGTLLISGMHRSIQKASNAITIYILFWIIIESAIGAWCITDFERAKETNKMVRYAQKLAAKNDFMAEFMIAEVMESVKNDPSISARLSNPFLSKEFIIGKISRGYMSKYLEKYNTSIYLYSHSGEGTPGFGTTQNYFDIKNRYAQDRNKTEFPELFILYQDLKTLSRHYMAFLPIERYGKEIGYIILDFRQKRLIPQNVYPELLVDNRFMDYEASEYSYGIFESGFLIQSSGDLDYSSFGLNKVQQDNPWLENGYLHYLLDDGKEDTIIVSAKNQYITQFISNGTFLLTILISPIILLLVIYFALKLYRGQQISYIAKIQLFLNLAFFVPLALVTITTLSFITSSFKQEQIDRKLEESDRLSVQIESETDAYLVNVTAKEILNDKLVELANYGHYDATVFGTDGAMITTTQPGIFNAGLQSEYLNPQALIKLVEQHESSSVETERIGNLRYYSTYSAIKSPETNRLLGILVIPFFQAERIIEKNQIEALNTILNVFIFIFILAMLTTFQTSKWLITPILLIRQKLGQTSFSEENKPIEWNSDDEIGKLIGEYNQMLVKLEASKEALARSQKESAWREVAQQVAHEIKNPLTPMKLTLQQLEHKVNEQAGSDAKLVATVKNLLNQLQMLNDIVTSFSEFAKMPIPQNQKVDIAEVLRELKTFFEIDEIINLELQLHAKEVFILADRKLMSRILSNIIINAGQSKKEGQDAVNVLISSEYVPGNASVQISVKDDGSGIDNEVVDRVFIPRFSTKKEGSGIGLAVAKHGIEHSGGTIWFETEWGKGTTFFLQLPEVS